MSQAERYYALARGGKEEFLAEAADGALVRRHDKPLKPPKGSELDTAGGFTDVETNVSSVRDLVRDLAANPGLYEVYPLQKKPGAAFANKITVGRTPNNDVVLNDVTVSRFHAYLRQSSDGWQLCDAGSKNGTRIGRKKLPARRETPIETGTTILFGEVETVFYTADVLFEVLSTTAS